MFWLKAIYKWWGYSWPLMVVIFLVDWIFIVTISSSGKSAVQFATNASQDSAAANKGAVLGLLFMFIGPFLNLWVWLKFVSFLREAIDDVSRQININLSINKKNQAIAILCAVIGAILVPIFLWLYTSNVAFLWKPDTSFWLQNGYWLGLVTALFLAFGARVLFPKQTKKVLAAISYFEGKIAT